jgi:hypothetical protein
VSVIAVEPVEASLEITMNGDLRVQPAAEEKESSVPKMCVCIS